MTSCSPDTLKDYLLGELSAAEEKKLREHLTACEPCQLEWDRLQLTQTTLLALTEEEPPRRTAFVSDQVFAPSWWQRLWRSGPQLGFVSAALLACAILAHGVVTRPASVVVTKADGPNAAMVQAQVEQEVEKRLRPLVAQAVAESELRINKRNAEIISASIQGAEERFRNSRKTDMVRVREALEYAQNQMNVFMVSNNRTPSHGEGE